jgi:hypothetical protein
MCPAEGGDPSGRDPFLRFLLANKTGGSRI